MVSNRIVEVLLGDCRMVPAEEDLVGLGFIRPRVDIEGLILLVPENPKILAKAFDSVDVEIVQIP